MATVNAMRATEDKYSVGREDERSSQKGRPGGRRVIRGVLPEEEVPVAESERRGSNIPRIKRGNTASELETAEFGEMMAGCMSKDENGSRTVHFGELVDQMRAQLAAQESLFILHPQSKRMQQYDMIILIALIFTALVTPYEVAYLKTKNPPDALFYVNRIVDLIFILDIVRNFMTAYREDKAKGGMWVRSHKKIAIRYFRGWCLIDIISILPFDTMGLFMSGGISQLKIVRIIRLLRLLKLARIMRASAIFKRWEANITVSYNILSLYKFAIIMLLLCHWMACFWGLLPRLQDATNETWIEANGYSDSPPGELYVACLYWAAMTISSIGYGDIVPNNWEEQLGCTFCMMIGGCAWAFVIGSVCGIVASLDPHTSAFRNTMDELNFFMEDKCLPEEMRSRLREYMHETRHLQHTVQYNDLIKALSPSMQGEVALHMNANWLDRVSYFRRSNRVDADVHKDFIVQVAMMLRAAVYAPKELMAGDTLHIIHRGVVAKEGRVLTAGMVWGADMILDSVDNLQRAAPARALTYTEVHSLMREDLNDVVEAYPEMHTHIRWAKMKMALLRHIVLTAKREKYAQDKEYAFADSEQTAISKRLSSKVEHAEEPTKAKSQLQAKQVHKKVDALMSAQEKMETLFRVQTHTFDMRMCECEAKIERTIGAMETSQNALNSQILEKLNVRASKMTGLMARKGHCVAVYSG